MTQDNPPPAIRDQRVTDEQHLKLLAVFHFVVAGLLFAGLGFLVVHFMIMNMVFTNPDVWKNSPNPPPPQLFAIFGYIYAFAGVLLIAATIANLLSGLYLLARKNRMFSLAVAALNCIQIPLGTVLGVLTILVLVRDSVRELYERGRAESGRS